jgi:hypothetical protein
MAFITSNSFLSFDVKLSGTSTNDTTTTPSNQVKIKPSDGAASDFFGYFVAVGSGRIVVGAALDDDNGVDSGSAYIFNLSGTQLAKIKPSDGAANDTFGDSVAVGSGRIVVGAPADDDTATNTGSAYIFNLSGTQLAKIKASDAAANDLFGGSVSVGSGRIVVGARDDSDNGASSGSAYIFDLNGNQLAKIKASDGAVSDAFGIATAVGSGRIVVGAVGDSDNGASSGSAYIFDLNGNQLAKIKPSDGDVGDFFGYVVSVGSGRIVVSAPFDNDNGSDSGSVYIFDLNGTQLAKIKASDGAANDGFGDSVSVGSGRIVVGADGDDDDGSGSGSVYVFDLSGTQLAKIKASDASAADSFGSRVAVGSGRIVVGAFGDDDNGSASGSAYIFTTPNQTHMLDLLE